MGKVDDKWNEGVKAGEKASSSFDKVNRVKFPAPPKGETSTTIIMFPEDNYEMGYRVFLKNDEGMDVPVIVSRQDWENGNEENPLVAEFKQTGDNKLKPKLTYFLNAIECQIKSFQKRDPKTKKPMVENGKPVVVRKSVPIPEIKTLETTVGQNIFKQIAAYRDDPDYPGGMTSLIFKVERTGLGIRDTSYNVKVSDKNVPDLSKVEYGELYNLTELFKPTSYDQIAKLLGVPYKGEGKTSSDEPDIETEDDDAPFEEEVDTETGEITGEDDLGDLDELEELPD